MGRVGGMMFDRAELVGGLKLLCLSLGLPTIVVPPTTLKKYVTGNGSAKKPLMMATIKRKWGRSFVSSDRADAFALEQFGLEFLGEQVVVRGEQACLKKATIEHPTDRMKSLSDAYDRALTRIA